MTSHKVIFKCYSGSILYGLNTPTSDVDIRGIFMASPEDYLSLDEPKDVIQMTGKDESYWSLRKYLRLLLKSNISALELLFAPTEAILEQSPEWEILKASRGVFIGKEGIRKSAIGYAQNQCRLQLKKICDGATVDWKNMMHCMRIMFFAEDLLEGSNPSPRASDSQREYLLGIRNRKINWADLYGDYERLLLRLTVTCETATLEDYPCKGVAEKLYRAMYKAWKAQEKSNA